MSKHVFNRVALTALLALALPAASWAAAPSQIEGVEQKVDYSDLDIQTEAGAKVLYARLWRASKKVCDARSFRESASTEHYRKSRACAKNVLESSVKKVDSDELAKLHAS